jgi:hypothetical protein
MDLIRLSGDSTMVFSRRTFCKSVAGMSVIPLLGAAQPAVEAASVSPTLQGAGKIILNVYLHGMFAIVFRKADKTVTLLPPHVSGSTPHIYIAGDMQGPPVRLEKDGYYGSDLTGVDTVPNIDPLQNVVINLSDTIKRSTVEPHCTIVLPLPHDFYPLRIVAPQDSSQYIFDDSTGLAKPPKAVPMVSMLQYQIPFAGKSYYLKYHYYAEPNICPADFHTTEAFHQLRRLFVGLKSLTINSDLGLNDYHDVPEPTPSAQLGVAQEDKLALVEWLGLKCEDPDYSNSNCPQNGNPDSPQKLIDSRGRPKNGPYGGSFGIHPTACMSMVAL